MNPPRYLDAGETALVVEFGDRIDDAVAVRVLALDAALGADLPAGVVELVPTYRSLMIHYDPLAIGREALVARVEAALMRPPRASRSGRLWQVPACYDPAFAEDMEVVAAATGLSPARISQIHARARYRVVMYGFAPGWAYLSGLPAALAIPRRTAPRDHIPAGSLIIAGGQAIVAAGAMPSGWHIIGRTPERLFAPDRDPAFLLEVGDWLTFEPLGRGAFDDLDAEARAGRVISSVVAPP